ncbi:putative nucleotidyltransferase, ribonuclease H [Tanacetum coccineum]
MKDKWGSWLKRCTKAGKLPSYPTLNPKHKPDGPEHVNMVTSLRNDFPKPPTQNPKAIESPKVGEGGVSSTTTPYPAALEKPASARLAKKGPHSKDMWRLFRAIEILLDEYAPILGYGDMVQGTITIKRVYYVEGLNHNLFSVGQFYDADLEVAFRKSTCYIRDLKGNDLPTGSRGTYLYSITLQDSSTPNLICLMAKATSSQAWLWHRRLSHLNFDTINLLSKNNIVNGLPKLKFVKDHLCSFCELGKAKRKSFHNKTTPSSKRRLQLLHMDLCGPMRVESINGKKNVLVIIDDYSCNISHFQGNDLLTGSRGTDLYFTTLQDSTTHNPICLMVKATSSQAWLWHRHLSHLNFDTINLLSKNNIICIRLIIPLRDGVRLRLFPFSLKDQAKAWFTSLEPVNLERQMGQLAKEVHKREAGKLPSYPTLNPNHKPGGPQHVNMVTSLRNDKKADNVKSDSELVNDLLKDFPKPPTQLPEATKLPKVGEDGVSSTTTPYPAALEKSASARLAKKGPHSEDMWETFKQVKINLPLIDAIKQIPVYAKFLKDLCTQKRKLKATLPKKIDLTEHVSAVLSSSLPPKFKDPGAPLISVVVGNIAIKKALLDRCASINILPASLVDKYDLGTLRKTDTIISLADRSTKIPRGILEDVIVKVDDFYYPVDFFVMDTESPYKDVQPTIILGRPFLATIDARINCRTSAMNITFGNKKLRLNVFNSVNSPTMNECYQVDVIDEEVQKYTPRTLKDDPLDFYLTSENEEILNVAEVQEIQECLVSSLDHQRPPWSYKVEPLPANFDTAIKPSLEVPPTLKLEFCHPISNMLF